MSANEYNELFKLEAEPLRKKALEDKLCQEINAEIPFQVMQGNIPDVFQYTHIPNERYMPSDFKTSKKARGQFFGQLKKLKKMGTKNGWPDFIFQFNDNKGSLNLEVKLLLQAPCGKIIYKGYLSHEQKLFQQECIKRNIPYYIVYSKDEAINVLKEYIIKLFDN